MLRPNPQMKHPEMRILFDARWYAHHNRLEDSESAWLHFVEHRARGFEPNPLFDSSWFKIKNPKSAKIDPLAFFLKKGSAKPVSPSPLFEIDWYLDNYPDVRMAGVDPYKHYLQWGRHEGRLPNHWCDPDYTGSAVFSLDVPKGFATADLLGYIPHYTTLNRLVSGSEVGAFFCPKRPFWIAAEAVSGEAQFTGGECLILGGKRELFSGDRVYLSCKQFKAASEIKAFQVRYAISPIIRNAMTVVGHDLSSGDKISRACEVIMQVVQSLPELPKSEVNVVADTIYAHQLRKRFNEILSFPVNIISLDEGSLCRVDLLMQRT